MLKECGKNTKSKKQSRAKTHTGARTERMDKSGRRSSKTVGGQTTTYIYDGMNLIAERGASVAEFLFGPGIDEPLAMSRSGSAYYYDVDGLGSAALVNDSSGTVQDKYLYDGWGITRSSTTPIPNPFVYTARETGETGLLFYRARYYNPSIGRFVSEDPLYAMPDALALFRLDQRQWLYSYVGNDPVINADPFGLERLQRYHWPYNLPRPPSTEKKESKCFYQFVVTYFRTDNWRDKLRHCVMGCILSKYCGPDFAQGAGEGKEIWDANTGGDLNPDDIRSAFDGIICSRRASDLEGCRCCCKEKGW